MKYSDDQIFRKDSTCDDKTVKSRYLNKVGPDGYKCNCCGIKDWNGKPIVLQLDHVNGIHTDNRWDNLRLLCANCHSQTDTYAGKNLWQTVTVSDEELIEAINSSDSQNEALRKVGLDVGRTQYHARVIELIRSEKASLRKTTFMLIF